MNRGMLAASAGLLAVSFTSGSLAPVSPPRPRQRFAGGYQVLAADFHVHSLPLSWGTLSPFDTVLEARRQGLDAIAMSGHNNVWVSQVGRWFSRLIGGPVVLTAEEIHSPGYHMIAVGIEHAVSWRATAAEAVEEIHRQGGVAIAAHPVVEYWPGWDAPALSLLDAAEVVHPVIFGNSERRIELRQFFSRKRLTAIGSSDFHYSEPMGLARTYVFVTENSGRGVMEALRQGHTVVPDRDGQFFGDPELIRLGVVPRLQAPPRSGFRKHLSLVTALLGLLIGAAAIWRDRIAAI